MEFAARPGTSRVDRWPSEVALAVLICLVSAAAWLLLALTIVGLVYAVMIGLFFWVGHLVFITHLKGSAVRLGPAQFPDLHQRVTELSRTVGLAEPPVAYVMEASGTLNALATRFLRTNFIVLFSDLLEACGDNDEARDFIIAHELGHVHAGHLRWRWFMLPGLMIPFVGTAYSRAREFTCDRYGMSVARDREKALRGLAILAAGGRRGALVNLSALAGQRDDLNSPLMQIGTWLSTHPPLCERVAVLEPAIVPGGVTSQARAATGGVAILASIVLVPTLGTVVLIGALLAAAGAARGGSLADELEPAATSSIGRASMPGARPTRVAAPTSPVVQTPPPDAARARRDIEGLAAVIDIYRVSHNGELPRDVATVYAAWAETHPGDDPPMDPFDGDRYGYEVQGTDYRLWSAGPQIEYSSRTRGFAR
jgi:Zn-dependent protease with chaperone function